MRLHFSRTARLSILARYSVAVAAQTTSGFLIVFAATHLLSANDYAAFTLLRTGILIAVSFGGLGLSQAAIQRFAEQDTQPIFSSTLFSAALTGSASGVVAAAVLLLFSSELGIRLTLPLIIGTIAATLVCTAVNEMFNWLRAAERPTEYALIISAKVLLETSCVIGVLVWTQNVANIFWAYGVANAATGVLAFAFSGILKKDLRPWPSLTIAKQLVGHGWPFGIVIGGGFLLNWLDRYVLAVLLPELRFVAYYDIGFLMAASGLALLVRPYNLYLYPAYVRSFNEHGGDATAALVNTLLKQFLFAGSALGVILSLISPALIRVIFPDEYAAGTMVIPAICYSMILNGVFMAVASGLYLSNRTLLVAASVACAVLVNVIALLIFVPPLGLIGAGIASVVAYASEIICAYLFVRRYIPTTLPWHLILLSGILFLGLTVFMQTALVHRH